MICHHTYGPWYLHLYAPRQLPSHRDDLHIGGARPTRERHKGAGLEIGAAVEWLLGGLPIIVIRIIVIKVVMIVKTMIIETMIITITLATIINSNSNNNDNNNNHSNNN